MTTVNKHNRIDAEVAAVDVPNDIALLQMTRYEPAIAFFREGRGVRVGDSIEVFGYPLQGMLSDQAKITTGIVNALAGLSNDSRFLQISAPVQSGNSGGPLLDRAGNVVGVVTSKLDAVKMMAYADEIPQNVNFALKASLVRDFLDANAVSYETKRSTEKMEIPDIADKAGQFTFLVECWQ